MDETIKSVMARAVDTHIVSNFGPRRPYQTTSSFKYSNLQGDTREEALKSIEEAIEIYLEDARRGRERSCRKRTRLC